MSRGEPAGEWNALMGYVRLYPCSIVLTTKNDN